MLTVSAYPIPHSLFWIFQVALPFTLSILFGVDFIRGYKTKPTNVPHIK